MNLYKRTQVASVLTGMLLLLPSLAMANQGLKGLGPFFILVGLVVGCIILFVTLMIGYSVKQNKKLLKYGFTVLLVYAILLIIGMMQDMQLELILPLLGFAEIMLIVQAIIVPSGKINEH